MIRRFSSETHDQIPCNAMMSNSGRSRRAISSANESSSNVMFAPDIDGEFPRMSRLSGIEIRAPEFSLDTRTRILIDSPLPIRVRDSAAASSRAAQFLHSNTLIVGNPAELGIVAVGIFKFGNIAGSPT